METRTSGSAGGMGKRARNNPGTAPHADPTVIPWSACGETALSNLALTCRRHHRAIHAGLWEITFINGIPNAHPT